MKFLFMLEEIAPFIDLKDIKSDMFWFCPLNEINHHLFLLLLVKIQNKINICVKILQFDHFA